MDSGMIGKIEKAKRYSEERHRFHFSDFQVTFHGDNNEHDVSFHEGVFVCNCEFFITHHHCGHSMALEILLKDMIPPTQET